MACINAYRLYLIHGDIERPLTHVQFRIQLYYKLLGYSIQAKLARLYRELGGKRKFNSDLPSLHYWEKLPKRSVCTWCAYIEQYKKVEGKKVERPPRRSIGGCIFCEVPLCKEGECWARFHSN